MTVRELETRIDNNELAEWMAFYQIEPWGERRADLRSGIVAATVANCHSAKGKFRPSDFMPKLDTEARVQTPQDIRNAALRINILMGGEVK